jgi:hypothetical protein
VETRRQPLFASDSGFDTVDVRIGEDFRVVGKEGRVQRSGKRDDHSIGRVAVKQPGSRTVSKHTDAVMDSMDKFAGLCAILIHSSGEGI